MARACKAVKSRFVTLWMVGSVVTGSILKLSAVMYMFIGEVYQRLGENGRDILEFRIYKMIE